MNLGLTQITLFLFVLSRNNVFYLFLLNYVHFISFHKLRPHQTQFNPFLVILMYLDVIYVKIPKFCNLKWFWVYLSIFVIFENLGKKWSSIMYN